MPYACLADPAIYGKQIYDRLRPVTTSDAHANALTQRTITAFGFNNYSKQVAIKSLMEKGLDNNTTKTQAEKVIQQIHDFFEDELYNKASDRGNHGAKRGHDA